MNLLCNIKIKQLLYPYCSNFENISVTVTSLRLQLGIPQIFEKPDEISGQLRDV